MNITKLSEKYISQHPSIKDCIIKKVINYSALAREICDFYKIERFDAVLIACRRYFYKLEKNTHEQKIIDLVRKTKLLVRNKIIVAIMEKPKDLAKIYNFQKYVKKEKADFNLIEGENVITIITNEKYEDFIVREFKTWILKLEKDLAQITMLFNPEIEITSGVVNYIYGLLADKGINVLEEMSCWTDLMIIIDEKDIPNAMDVLNF
jgi:aspartokinase